jgi:colicin import membrane protein
MAWEEDLDPDWIHELPFYLVATIAYGALLTVNPAVRWGSGKSAADASVPIEFVAALPEPPKAEPAPPPPEIGKAATPQNGPGVPVPEKVKAGDDAAPPKPAPKPAPTPARKPRPKPAPAKAAKPVDVKAMIAASAAKREKLDRAKAAAEARAEAAREEKAQRLAAAQAEADRMAAVEKARQEKLAAARAAKAQKKAELSQELATMTEPDEALTRDPAPTGGKPAPAPGSGAAKLGAAAALADSGGAQASDESSTGSGGGDLLDAKAKGGGTAPDGGVSYTLDGPVGARRVLKRAVPTTPDWVGARNLDLTVTIRFQVLPDGAVKPGAVIQKTSGFPEIDRRALDALRKWRFEPAPDGDASEVWGRASFRFTS